MIAYEKQLWYVIRAKIQSETKSDKKNFIGKKIFVRKKFLDFVSDFQCAFYELSRTNHH